MNFCSKKYMTRLFGFSDEVEGVNMTFKDKILEENYLSSNKEKEYLLSKIFCALASVAYIILIFLTIYLNSFKFVRNTYICIVGLLIEILLFGFSNFYTDKIRVFLILKNFRFIILYIMIGTVILFPVNVPDPNSIQKFRVLFSFIYLVNFGYIYYLDFNIVLHILVPILNTILIFLVEIIYDYPIFFFIPEILSSVFIYFFTYFVKKYEFSNKKEIFFKQYKKEHYIEYIDQLINILNTMVISIKNDEVLFTNNFAVNYLKLNKKSKMGVEEIILENEIPLSNSSFINSHPQILYDYMNSFFESLILDVPLENEVIAQEKNKSLMEIITNIFSDKNFESKDFTKIGFFKTTNDSKFFEIHLRKLYFKEEVIEILINDFTEVKLAVNLESKYKQKILAKIAHEFKTPLITIISLIHKIIYQENNNNNLYHSTKISLNHINYLSNYTLVLISDIIQYVSNSINLRLNKSEIILKEVLEFGFNVLKTLVDCNENKVNKVKTILENDENVENITVMSDENRLKQILLNFISNAVKFTISGFIKIRTKYNSKNNSVKIIVKDSGLGIKSQDHDQIFKENVQLNVNNEYNSKGTGLGLSITKTLANSLDHEIGFKSNIGHGSEFYLKLKCLKLNSGEDSKLISINQKRNTELVLHSRESYSSISQKVKSCDNLQNICLLELSNSSSLDRSNKHNLTTTIKKENLIINQERDSKFEITRFFFSLGNIINDDNTICILVIDDHKLLRDITINLIKNVMTLLNIANYRIIEGSDGIDLLNILRLDKDHKIKSIFIDENMEYMNGSEAVRIIRKFEKNNKIKNYNIISITAFDDPDTKNYILNCGMNSIISKPCTRSQILNIMQNIK